MVSPSCNHTMTINSTIIHTQCSTFTPLEYIFLQEAIHTRYTFKLTRLLHMSPRKETDCCYPITRSTIMHSGIQNVSKSSTCNRLYSGRTLWMEGLFQADKGNWKCLGWFYIGAIALPNIPFIWVCYAALFCGTIPIILQYDYITSCSSCDCFDNVSIQATLQKIAKQKNPVEMDKS